MDSSCKLPRNLLISRTKLWYIIRKEEKDRIARPVRWHFYWWLMWLQFVFVHAIDIFVFKNSLIELPTLLKQKVPILEIEMPALCGKHFFISSICTCTENQELINQEYSNWKKKQKKKRRVRDSKICTILGLLSTISVSGPSE